MRDKQTYDEAVKTDVELFEDRLKHLVEVAGCQSHAVFDELCQLAKKLI